MKKALVTTLVLAMAFTMAGCGSSKKGAEKTASSAAAAVSSEAAAVSSEAAAVSSEAAAVSSEAAAAVSEAQEAAADTASVLEAAVTDTVSTAAAAAEDVVSKAEGMAEDVLSEAENAAEDAAAALTAAAEDVISAVEEVPDEVISGAAEAAAAVGAAAATAADAAADAADDVLSVVPSVVVEELEGTASIAEDALSTAEDAMGVIMSYDEYVAAPVDTPVSVETYVQAKQAWWEKDGQGKATIYTQDEDGAYFVYDMNCSEEDYNALVEGQKIVVNGYKGEWAGEVEIVDAGMELADGNYIAEAKDVTALLGTDEIADSINQKVCFKGLTVEAAEDGTDSAAEPSADAAAYLYGWDGSGQEGDDLYFKASLNGQTYTFVVESYLCDSSTDVYKAVKELKVGDKIDMEGFLYWYEGAQPHITSVTAAA